MNFSLCQYLISITFFFFLKIKPKSLNWANYLIAPCLRFLVCEKWALIIGLACWAGYCEVTGEGVSPEPGVGGRFRGIIPVTNRMSQEPQQPHADRDSWSPWKHHYSTLAKLASGLSFLSDLPLPFPPQNNPVSPVREWAENQEARVPFEEWWGKEFVVT